MAIKELDAAIIGAGTAGMYAVSRVLRKTDRVRIFDGGKLGTTCARVGCMPSKMLVHAGDQPRGAGIYPNNRQPEKDLSLLFGSIRERRDRLAGNVVDRLKNRFGEILVTEDASFSAPMTLRAGDEEYRCRGIVIAAGSSPTLPPGWKKYPNLIVTTDDFFDLEKIPANILVIGLGFIGVEIGQALARLGKNVSAVEMTENVAGISDPAVKKVFCSALKEDLDINLSTRAELESVEDGKIRVAFVGKDERKRSRIFDLVIVASGRKPPLGRLKLGKSGLKLDKRGFPVFDNTTLRCQGGDVFLAGDFSRLRPLYHAAVEQGKLAGYNVVHPRDPRLLSAVLPLSIVFTRPEIGAAGKSYTQLGSNSLIGEADLRRLGRGVAEALDYGIIRLYADGETGRVAGAELAAPGGEHLIHLIAVMVEAKMTVDDALGLPFYHPTYEEGVQKALKSLRSKLKRSSTKK